MSNQLRRIGRLTIAFLLSIVILSLISFPSLEAALSDIQDRGQLIVAVKDNLRPLGFRDAQGNLQGLEIDLAHNLAQTILGDADAVILKPVSNQERLDLLLQNQVDLVIADLTVTKPRSRLVVFSNYYYLDGTGLISSDLTINSVKQLYNGKIAVLRGSGAIAVLKSSLPQAQLVGVNSYQEALSLLETKQVQAFASDLTLLTGWIQEYPQYRLLPERLSGEPLAIAMPKGLQYLQLRQQVNSAIAQWQQSGWLQERINHWGLPIDK